MEKVLTIALPTYNRSAKIAYLLDFLYEEIRLLTETDKKAISIYVSDNCSPDNTKEIILCSKLFKESLIDCEYSRNEKNLGLLGNLKKIYTTPCGEYLWMMGDDDEYKQGIVKLVFEECKKQRFSYIFINHTTYKDGKIIQQSVLEDFDAIRTDQHSLLDLYFHSGTVMMFMSACVYKTSIVNSYVKKHGVNLVTPCALSFYCASKGETKYIQESLILNDWTDISWRNKNTQVFAIEIPALFLKLPFYGYSWIKCYQRTFMIVIRRWKGIVKYHLYRVFNSGNR